LEFNNLNAKTQRYCRNPEASGLKERPVQMNGFFFLSFYLPAIGKTDGSGILFCFVLRQAQHDKTKKIERTAGSWLQIIF